MKAVFHGDMACRIGQAMPARAGEAAELVFLDGITRQDVLEHALVGADVLVSMAFDGRHAKACALRLLQVPGIGLDHIEFARLPVHTKVAVCRGHDEAVAEYVLATVIASRRRLFEAADEFRGGSWAMSSRAGGPLTTELRGSAALVIGGGSIGRRLTSMFHAFGVQVTCCTRFPFEPPPGASIVPRSALHDALSTADTVVLACALDASSRHLIDEAALARMKANALLVNIARGDCVDEAALCRACAERRVGGAVLDVWYSYPSAGDASPRPSGWPFESLTNVLMTPHISAWTTQVVERRATAIARNLIAIASGAPIADEVVPPLREELA